MIPSHPRPAADANLTQIFASLAAQWRAHADMHQSVNICELNCDTTP